MEATRVETVRPVLDIRTTNAKIHIRNNNRMRMRVKYKRPVMHVKRENAEFRINWNRINRALEKKFGDEYTIKMAYQAKQRIMDALNKLPDAAGNDTARIENEIIHQIEAMHRKSSSSSPKIDYTRPTIEWEMGDISIEWSDYDLTIEWENLGGPQIEVEPYSVEVRIRNQPVVRFVFNLKKTGDHVGKKFDKSI